LQALLAQLNPPQQQAVRWTEGPLLVLAGAGSGKTRVLTSRVAYLLADRGVPPSQIMAITFTNKAAREMKERLVDLVGERAEALWVSTFHAACARILRREIEHLGYTRNFVIYDTADQQSLLKTCLQELNLDEKRFNPRAVGGLISQAKNNLLAPEAFAREASTWYRQEVARVYRLYQAKLKKLNALDFDDLIMQVVTLFSHHPEVLASYQRQFRYVLVDEYQDTNHSQYRLVKQLVAGHNNICVVGDPDQSIYRWRGADIQNILDFEKDFPAARVIRLEQNYRSTQTILEAANAVIANNEGRKPKNLWTDNGRGDPVFYYSGENEWAEGRYVAGEISRQLGREQRCYRDFAVLYRTHAQSRVFEEVFLQSGIPYQIVGGLKFYDRKEIKDLVAYLRVIQNPADDISLARIFNVPKRSLGETTWSRLADYAAAHGISVMTAIGKAEEVPGLTSRALRSLSSLSQLIQAFQDLATRLKVTELVERVLEDSGYLAELQAEGTPEAQARVENLWEFLSVARDYDRRSPDQDLAGFLAQISLITDIDDMAEAEDRVVLMTLHTAKGLEFPVVFLVGMEERVFPHAQSLADPAETEEERRLCYVGMTRARERLYLTNAYERTLYGNTVTNEPSRFLREIPPQLLAQEGFPSRHAARYRPWSGGEGDGSNAKIVAQPPVPTAKRVEGLSCSGGGFPGTGQFALGDKVHHAKWGTGVIVQIQQDGGDQKLKVAFPDLGIKDLLASYAPIRKL